MIGNDYTLHMPAEILHTRAAACNICGTNWYKYLSELYTVVCVISAM